MLRNDVMSHVRTMESLNQAGRALLEVGSGDGPHGLQSRLEQLNESWEFVRCETERRQLELENRLSQVGTRPYVEDSCMSLGTGLVIQQAFCLMLSDTFTLGVRATPSSRTLQ